MSNDHPIIDDCYRIAGEELKKITCYDIPTDLDSAYTHHSYTDGYFFEHIEGDRGETHTSKIGSTKHEFVSHLLYRKIRAFAFNYELHHRRKFESNLRQTNEIIRRCYSYLDSSYECPSLNEPSDNVHICFDLLEHYLSVCRKLMNKTSIPEETMRRIRFIACKEYANKNGGMMDVNFALDHVRYNVEEIIRTVPLPLLKNEFRMYEEQYSRLLQLEKQQPQNDKYPLGSWDNDTFREAEEMLKGKRLIDGEALKCALYILMNAAYHERAAGLNIDLCFHKDIDITKYRAVLDELFIYDKYGVYHFGPSGNITQDRKNRLNFGLLER